jgi:glycosyltransferase involved in cell wall biosynthesis
MTENMQKRICILTQSHLCRNPRVVKEANALADAGHDVTILTTFSDATLLEEDLKLIDTARIKLKGIVNIIPGQTSKLYRLKERIKRRLAGEFIARLGWENVYALGYDYRANLKAAFREDADLYTCHQEISTVIGCKLMKHGRKVAFDFEDWYSHDLLPAANRTRPLKLLEKYERYALKHAPLVYTTSNSMAVAMAEFFGSAVPKVLHNVFPLAERKLLDGAFKDRKDTERPSIHWYSQTIGPGRGLEFLAESLHLVDVPVDLHLRGNLFGDFGEQLRNKFPHEKGHRIFFHELVPHNELLSRIAEHDIGLATEEYTPDSRNLTITNKILQYLLAGIAVVASDTSGQKEVAEAAPDAVALFKNKNKESFVAALNSFLKNPDKLKQAKTKALQYAENRFCWERQKHKLVAWVDGVGRS